MGALGRRFIKNGLILTAVAVFTRGVALFFNSYISRTIGAEGVGLFSLVMTLYAFGVTFATSGISLAVTTTVAGAIGEGKDRETSRIFRAAVAYALFFSSVAFLVFFIFADSFATFVLSEPRAGSLIRILSLSLVPIGISSVVSGYFIGLRRVSKNAAVAILSQIARVVLTVILIGGRTMTPERGAATVAIAMTLAELFSLVLSVLQYLFDKSRRCGGVGRHLLPLSKIALPLALSSYVRSALLTLEHALIPKKLREYGESSEGALASYGILHGMALPLVLFPLSPLSSFAGMLVPEFSESFSKNDGQRLSRIAKKSVEATLQYALAVATLLLVFSEELGYLFYSSYEAGRYIAVLALVVPIMYLDHVSDAILKGIGEQVYSMLVNISDAVLSIVLVIVLIPRMGVFGYAVVI